MDAHRQERRGPLTLLMTNQMVRRSAAIVAALPLLYLASFGPACWIISRTVTGMSAYRIIYRPVDTFVRERAGCLPSVFFDAFDVYCHLLVAPDIVVAVGFDNSVGPDMFINGGWSIDAVIDPETDLPVNLPDPGGMAAPGPFSPSTPFSGASASR